jgi:predicted nucleic acid-binding protein
VKRPVLLDASFLIDFDRETTERRFGPAHRTMDGLRHRRLVISIVTVEEILEGAADLPLAIRSLQRFSIQGLQMAHARRCALMQRRSPRRMGENDAWLVATAMVLDADVVGADRAAFERLGVRYLRFR